MFPSDNINILNTKTPIMVIVGPIGSGKTMTVYRLFDWLFNNGYTIEVDRLFRLDTTELLHMEYPRIFEIFKNDNNLTSLFRPFNCAFIPFMTGCYHHEKNRFEYCPGPNVYPANLWKKIMKLKK